MSPARRLLAMLTVGALAVPNAAAGPLGRLFFTPEQRTALNLQRRAEALRADSAGTAMRLDGFAAASRGAATVWINGIPRRDRPHDAAALRVGESLDLLTRQKRDVVAPGAIRIGHGHVGALP